MNAIETVVLPALMMLFAFAFKLFVDRQADVISLLNSLFELPVDIAFFGTSLAVAYLISGNSTPAQGLVHFGSHLAVCLVCVVLWRRSNASFTSSQATTNKKSRSATFFNAVHMSIWNYAAAITALSLAIRYLDTAGKTLE